MSSATTWLRLEPYSRSGALEGGLKAAVHDPLWLLARQWQLGEFQGEDAGSPAQTFLAMNCTPITRYRSGAIPGDWYQEDQIRPDARVEGDVLDGAIPLEALIERETVRMDRRSRSHGDAGAVQPRLSAEAGLHFWRLLQAHGVRHEQRAAFIERFALKAPSHSPERPFDADTRRFLQVMVGRVPDGELLFHVLESERDPAYWVQLAEPYRGRVAEGVETWRQWTAQLAGESPPPNLESAQTAWLTWYRQELFSEPAASAQPSWIPERMEYAALVAAPAPGGEVVLSVPEYAEGHLDWYSFDLLPAGSLMAHRDDLLSGRPAVAGVPGETASTYSVTPVPIAFQGMPASRYWEFEDARIDFGGVAAGLQQLVRLLLIEFGLVGGKDWYVVPAVAPVGSLCQIDSLVVTDTFGERTRVRSARTVDGGPFSGRDGGPGWDLFRLCCDRRAALASGCPTPDALFLPPALGTSLHSAPLEEVVFLRDEMANMAWAVERIVANRLGQPADRAETVFRGGGPHRPPADSGLPVYRLATVAPEHWVPLVPERIHPENPDDPSIGLRRWPGSEGRLQGLILEPNREALDISDEEVPREGVRVTRAFQYTRWIDGTTHLWIGRRKGVGRGEGSSALQFDVLDSPQPRES